jgi:hypothetical protein
MRIIRISLVAFVLCGVVFVLLLAASIHTYNMLTDETLIAEIRFERTGEREYAAHLKTGDFCDEQTLRIRGDQWRIDAEFLKWKYWASLFGLDSQYRLERFEGRYRSVDEQNSQPVLAHALGEATAVDIVRVAESLGGLNFLVDATYGASTYQSIDTTRIHSVYKTPTGIFTRSVPRPVAEASAEGLPIEIDAACGAPRGVWRRITDWTDTAARRAVEAVG